jgi:hypothetical protein
MGGDFVTVPYTFHMNDIVSFPFENYNPVAYEQALKDEFDQLYEEGAHRRRMMVISLHDRISGHANRVRVLDRFLTYAKSKPSVWFARKDEIAKWTLEHRSITPVYDRGARQSAAFRVRRPDQAAESYERRLFVRAPSGILLELVFREGDAASNSQRTDRHA